MIFLILTCFHLYCVIHIHSNLCGFLFLLSFWVFYILTFNYISRKPGEQQLCPVSVWHENILFCIEKGERETEKGRERRKGQDPCLWSGTYHPRTPPEPSGELAVKNLQPQGCVIQNWGLNLIVTRPCPPFLDEWWPTGMWPGLAISLHRPGCHKEIRNV